LVHGQLISSGTKLDDSSSPKRSLPRPRGLRCARKSGEWLPSSGSLSPSLCLFVCHAPDCLCNTVLYCSCNTVLYCSCNTVLYCLWYRLHAVRIPHTVVCARVSVTRGRHTSASHVGVGGSGGVTRGCGWLGRRHTWVWVARAGGLEQRVFRARKRKTSVGTHESRHVTSRHVTSRSNIADLRYVLNDRLSCR
jgi:hypothetical protein